MCTAHEKSPFLLKEMIDRINGDNSMNGQFSVSMTQTLCLSLNVFIKSHESWIMNVDQSKFQSFQILVIQFNEILWFEQTNKQTYKYILEWYLKLAKLNLISNKKDFKIKVYLSNWFDDEEQKKRKMKFERKEKMKIMKIHF